MSNEQVTKLIETGKREYLAGHRFSAIAMFQQAQKLDANDQELRLRLGDALREVGLVREAEATLKSIDKLPERSEWYRHASLGKLFEDIGNYPSAESYYRRAVELHPESTVPWVLLGALLSRQGRVQEALEIFYKGATACGDVDEVFANIGNCLMTLARYEQAKVAYEKAIEIFPEDTKTALALEDVTSLLSILGTSKAIGTDIEVKRAN